MASKLYLLVGKEGCILDPYYIYPTINSMLSLCCRWVEGLFAFLPWRQQLDCNIARTTPEINLHTSVPNILLSYHGDSRWITESHSATTQFFHSHSTIPLCITTEENGIAIANVVCTTPQYNGGALVSSLARMV